MLRSFLLALGALLMGSVMSVAAQGGVPDNSTVIALTRNNLMHVFRSMNSDVQGQTRVRVSGLQAMEKLVGIDYRPANGLVYALSNSNNLYTVDITSGAATLAGELEPNFVSFGAALGIDWNPVVNLLRVVDDSGKNGRVNTTANGILVLEDSDLGYNSTDLNSGRTPLIRSVAYTNNVAGASSTTLYAIDKNTESLVIVNPPNDGVLQTVATVASAVSRSTGFEIVSSGGLDFGLVAKGKSFFRLNLTSGASRRIFRSFVARTIRIAGLTVIPPSS